MDPQIFATIVAGVFLFATTVTSIITALMSKRTSEMTKRTSDSVMYQSAALSKKFDETAKVVFIEGENECFDALTRLTLQENIRAKVTRFNTRKIQRQKRYYKAMVSKVLGTPFEDQSYKQIDKYYRLTSLNSQENKDSLIEMCKYFKNKECTNLILRVTLDKNDFELVIFEQLKTAAFCFHDFAKNDVLHSCLITRDESLFVYFSQLYEKIWQEDTILEIDFSLGDAFVEDKIKLIESLPVIDNKEDLSPIEGTKIEAKYKIDLCDIISKQIKL